jgi:hypothetical protein
MNLPPVQFLGGQPIPLAENEVLQAQVQLKLNTSGTLTALNVSVVVFLADRMVAAPADGQLFWLGGGTTGTASPLQWTPIQGSGGAGGALPAGTYGVVAMEHRSATAIAARIQFPGATYRPGVISVRDAFSQTNPTFYTGPFGIVGTFESFAPPVLEVLCAEPDTEHDMFLGVIKLS